MNLGTASTLQSMAQFIQLAIAPIFFLSGVGTTLLVFVGRLARIVDRGRSIEARPAIDKAGHAELMILEKRAQLIYRALMFGVSAAICVAMLMTLAFAGEVFRINTAREVAGLFMVALFSYTIALVCLWREVFLAITNFRLGIHSASPD